MVLDLCTEVAEATNDSEESVSRPIQMPLMNALSAFACECLPVILKRTVSPNSETETTPEDPQRRSNQVFPSS